jgi:hypothetical protein
MHYPSSVLSKIAERVAATCAYAYLLCMTRKLNVRYRVAKDPATFAKIGKLRRDVYRTADSSYLLNELDKNGLDSFDQNATSFIAETRSSPSEVFAAVRAVHYPFEVLQYISEDFLADRLDSRDFASTVEVSRLVSSRPNKIVTNGLILFGGVYIALHGATRYFAYVALPERSASRPPSSVFAIPNRNPNGYTIVSGSIAKHTARVGPRLWRSTKSPGVAKYSGPPVVTRRSEPT